MRESCTYGSVRGALVMSVPTATVATHERLLLRCISPVMPHDRRAGMSAFTEGIRA